MVEVVAVRKASWRGGSCRTILVRDIVGLVVQLSNGRLVPTRDRLSGCNEPCASGCEVW
jgi:hypothetical protein